MVSNGRSRPARRSVPRKNSLLEPRHDLLARKRRDACGTSPSVSSTRRRPRARRSPARARRRARTSRREVVWARLGALAVLGVHGPADGPDAAVLPLDPEHDPLRHAGLVEPVEHPLGVPPGLRRRPHEARIQSLGCLGSARSSGTPSPFCSREELGGALRRLCDPRARSRPVARRHPRRPVRRQPALE